jgi:hypothetical protein
MLYPDFTHFLAFWAYLGAPRGPSVSFWALRPVNLKLRNYSKQSEAETL